MKTCDKCGNRVTSAQKLFEHLRIRHGVQGFSRRGRGSQLGRIEHREEKREAPGARQPRPVYQRDLQWRRGDVSSACGAMAAAAASPQTSVSFADASSQTATQVSWPRQSSPTSISMCRCQPDPRYRLKWRQNRLQWRQVRHRPFRL